MRQSVMMEGGAHQQLINLLEMVPYEGVTAPAEDFNS